MAKWAILGAGCALGSTCWGQIATPEYLRKIGLIERLKHDYVDFIDCGNCNELAWHRDWSHVNLQNLVPLSQYLGKLFGASLQACEAAEKLLLIGGDHSVSMASIAARLQHLKNKYPDQKFAVLWIDAHADINTAETTPSGNLHGMILSSLLGLGPIDLQTTFGTAEPILKPEEIIYLGLRSVDPGEQQRIRELNIFSVDQEFIQSEGMSEALNRVINYLEMNRYQFIASYDIDICDPIQIPAVCTLTPNGISLHDAELIAEKLTATNLCVGLDFVELDAENPYAQECGKFMIELIARFLKP